MGDQASRDIARTARDECPFPEEPQDVAFPLMIPLSMEVRDIFAQIPRHRQWASLIVAVGVSNFAHAPLVRHASEAKASESMAVFSNAAFDWKKRAIHNLYWIVAIDER